MFETETLVIEDKKRGGGFALYYMPGGDTGVANYDELKRFVSAYVESTFSGNKVKKSNNTSPWRIVFNFCSS